MNVFNSTPSELKSSDGVLQGFQIQQDTLDHLPSPLHKRVAQKLIEEGTWFLVPSTKA